jgi:hypothetical protein
MGRYVKLPVQLHARWMLGPSLHGMEHTINGMSRRALVEAKVTHDQLNMLIFSLYRAEKRLHAFNRAI